MSDAFLLCFDDSPETNILVSREYIFTNADKMDAEHINKMLRLPKDTIYMVFQNENISRYKKPWYLEKSFCLFVEEDGTLISDLGKIYVNEDNIWFLGRNLKYAHPIESLRTKNRL
jgi:hypothetical protein